MAVWEEWKRNIKGYNRNVRLFLWANLMFQIGMGMFMIIYNLYVQALGHSQIVIGNVIAMTSLAAAIVLIPLGFISDRIGRKKVIVIGLLLSVLSFGLRSIFESEAGLLITALMTGVFSAALQVTAIPFLSENSTKQERVHLFSFNFALMMVANVVGNVGGGLLTDFFHYMVGFSNVVSIRYTLLIGTAIAFAALFPALAIREEKKQHSIKSASINIKEMIHKNKQGLKIIGLFAIAQMLIGFGAGLVIPYLNVYFHDRFDASKSAIGIIVALGQAATAVAMLIGPMLVRRLGEVKAVVVLQLTSIPFLLITGFTTNFYLAATGFLFRQALMNAGNPIQMSIMMGRVADNMKGLANSVGQMVFMLGWAIMGPVSTWIVSSHGTYWGYSIVFSITAILYVIGSTYFYLVFGANKRILAEQDEKVTSL